VRAPNVFSLARINRHGVSNQMHKAVALLLLFAFGVALIISGCGTLLQALN
jgi:hypothetical protein